jgi:peptide/nickel transport system permease protein
VLNFIARRIASIAIVMAVVGVTVFLILRLVPGDPIAILDAIRKNVGLDDPLPVQFWRWAGAVLRGDFGISIFSGAPVLQLITERLEPTISLTLVTLFVAVPIAVAAGITAAARAGSAADRTLMALSVVGFSVPGFVVGYLLIYVFAITLKWLPVQGYVPIADGVWPWLQRLILPAATLGFAYVALIARITRTAMLDVLNEDYIRTAKAKGVAPTPTLFHHALKNAGVPIVTIIGIGLAVLIGGAIVTETVFNLPGVGRLVVDAIQKRDYPVIQGITLLLSATYVLVNLLIDLTYTLIDPRVRY